MKTYGAEIIPESHKCRQCAKGAKEVHFSVKVDTNYVRSICNQCYYRNVQAKKAEIVPVRERIAEYFRGLEANDAA